MVSHYHFDIVGNIIIFILQQAQYTFTHTIMSYSYHFILGVLLGEVIQSSWTIVKLTFQRPKTQWDGQALLRYDTCP